MHVPVCKVTHLDNILNLFNRTKHPIISSFNQYKKNPPDSLAGDAVANLMISFGPLEKAKRNLERLHVWSKLFPVVYLQTTLPFTNHL